MGESRRTFLRAHRGAGEDGTGRLSRRVGDYDPAEDFRDVFGGPPRSVLLRRFSGADLPAFSSGPRPAPPSRPGSSEQPVAARRARVRTEPGFFDDIFGSDSRERRSSRSGSKSNASELVLSSEFVSPPLLSRAPSAAENAVLSSASVSFPYKLSPINVPPRNQTSPSPSSTKSREASSSSTTSLIAMRDPTQINSCFQPAFNHSSGRERGSAGDMPAVYGCGFSSSPETFSLESSFRGNRVKPLPWEITEPEEESITSSSVVSPPVILVGAERDPRSASVMMEVEGEEEEGEDAEGLIVLEFHDAAGLDDAITWANDKHWN